MQAAVIPAVESLTQIIEDVETSPQVRINAANAILTHYRAYSEAVDIGKRLSDLENQKEQIEALWLKIQGVRHG